LIGCINALLKRMIEQSATDEGDISGGTEPPIQTTLYFNELTGAIYARMVDKVGNKHY